MKILLTIILLFTFSFLALSQSTQEQVDILISKGQYQNALSLINDSPQKSKELLLKEAQCYRFLREYPKAIFILENLSYNNTNALQAKLQLAFCYEAANLPEKAMKCYDELIELDPTNVYLKQADILYQLNKYTLALQQYRLLSDENSSAFLLKKTAMCFEKLNQLDNAKAYPYLKQAYLQDSTNNNVLYYNRYISKLEVLREKKDIEKEELEYINKRIARADKIVLEL